MPDASGALPEMLLLEVLRQAGYFMAHSAVGVPLDWHLVTTRLRLQWRANPPRVGRGADFTCEISGSVGVPTTRKLEFSAEVRAGTLIATGGLEAYRLGPQHYRALRKHSPQFTDKKLDPPDVANARIVTWNDQDPFLFNKPGDHVVSMALVDAVLSNVDRAGSTAGVSFDMEFLRFAEHGPAITLHQRQDGGGEQHWEFWQSSQLVARAVTSMD